MLTVDPTRRISLDECATHVWCRTAHSRMPAPTAAEVRILRRNPETRHPHTERATFPRRGFGKRCVFDIKKQNLRLLTEIVRKVANCVSLSRKGGPCRRGTLRKGEACPRRPPRRCSTQTTEGSWGGYSKVNLHGKIVFKSHFLEDNGSKNALAST